MPVPNARASEVVLTGLKGEPLVRKTPDVCGGEACIRNSRIMVWLLVSLMRQGMTDDDLLANYPTLALEHLDAARAYCRQHPEEIDAAIAASEEHEEGV
jgi:uncharacterized protein (DUF433 family)